MQDFSRSHLSLSRLSDGALDDGLTASFAKADTATATVLAFIGEFDARQLYRQAGHPSMYSYLLHVRHLSESAAYRRIGAARVARQFPAVFPMVSEGRLHLSGIVELAPHLTPENADELLAAATHKTRAEIVHLLAQRFPKPDLPEKVRPLLSASAMATPADSGNSRAAAAADQPAAESAGDSAPPIDQPATTPTDQPVSTPTSQRASGASDELALARVRMTTPGQRVTPLAPRRYGVQFTIDERTHEMLDRVRALMGRPQPAELLATIFARGLETILREQERKKFSATSRPCPERRGKSTRHVPAPVRRKVWKRDGGQCTFTSDGGQRAYGAEFMRHKREAAKQARAAKRKARRAERNPASQMSPASVEPAQVASHGT